MGRPEQRKRVGMAELLGKINNDTVAIIGLIAIACFYAATGTGEQVVAAITGGMLGYITRANNQ